MSVLPINAHSLTRMSVVKNAKLEMTLDGVPIFMVTILGVITGKIKKKAGKVSFKVSDGTGIIGVDMEYKNPAGIVNEEERATQEDLDIIGADAERQQLALQSVELPSYLHEHGYVKILGKLRCDMKSGSARYRISTECSMVKPITDFNEVTRHSLDVIHTFLLLTK